MVLHAITLALCTLIYTICIHVFYCVRIGIIKIRRQNYLLYYLQYIPLITTITTTSSSALCYYHYYYSFPFILFIIIQSFICSVVIAYYYTYIIYILYSHYIHPLPTTAHIRTCRYIYPSPYSTRSSLGQSAISLVSTVRISTTYPANT